MQLPEHFMSDMVAVFAFGIVALVTLLIAYKGFDKLTPLCDFQVELAKGNRAVATVLSGFFIAIAIMIAAVTYGIVG